MLLYFISNVLGGRATTGGDNVVKLDIYPVNVIPLHLLHNRYITPGKMVS